MARYPAPVLRGGVWPEEEAVLRVREELEGGGQQPPNLVLIYIYIYIYIYI
jgi:hypothetical protein